MSQCRSCQAPITWKFTKDGVRMPIDVDPVPEGNIVIRGYRCEVVAPGKGTHVAHFATCPDAPKFRKRR